MGKLSRQRGQQGERELCALIRSDFGTDTKRKLGQERDSGNDVDLYDFTLESKRVKAFVGVGWMDQAVEATPSGKTPVVAVRPDPAPGRKSQWYVMMLYEDWAKLVRESLP